MTVHIKQVKCDCYTDDGQLMACPLHAAARALLEALQEAEKAIAKLPHSWGFEFDILAHIRAAIAQAKGD
jgi:hypothetical protein